MTGSAFEWMGSYGGSWAGMEFIDCTVSGFVTPASALFHQWEGDVNGMEFVRLRVSGTQAASYVINAFTPLAIRDSRFVDSVVGSVAVAASDTGPDTVSIESSVVANITDGACACTVVEAGSAAITSRNTTFSHLQHETLFETSGSLELVGSQIMVSVSFVVFVVVTVCCAAFQNFLQHSCFH